MDDPNEEARKLAADFWEDILQLEPMIGTMVGDERFDDKLSDPGPEGRARSEEVHRRALSLSAPNRAGHGLALSAAGGRTSTSRDG